MIQQHMNAAAHSLLQTGRITVLSYDSIGPDHIAEAEPTFENVSNAEGARR
jgi:hypothetical protein